MGTFPGGHGVTKFLGFVAVMGGVGGALHGCNLKTDELTAGLRKPEADGGDAVRPSDAGSMDARVADGGAKPAEEDGGGDAGANLLDVSDAGPSDGGSGASDASTVFAITSFVPSVIPAGTSALTLLINGSNFPAAAKVRINGSVTLTPISVASNQIKVAIPAGEIATPTTLTVFVVGPLGDSVSALLRVETSAPSNPSLLGGIVAADRILTLQESPYQLSADLQIPYGVTLQTEPGVVVYGNAKALVVAGTFLAKGTSDKPIRIRGLKIEQGGSASAKPHRIELDHVDMSGGTLYAPGTDTEYGSLRLVDSRLSDVGSYLNIWYPTGDVLVERNVFSHCGGFHVGFKASPVPIQVVIRNNYFGDWTTTYAVENYASYDSAKGVLVEHNTFASTDRPALGLEDECDACRMTAENNWWLTTNAQAIAGRIVDANDNVRIGSAIPFEPALSAPHPQTPLP